MKGGLKYYLSGSINQKLLRVFLVSPLDIFYKNINSYNIYTISMYNESNGIILLKNLEY